MLQTHFKRSNNKLNIHEHGGHPSKYGLHPTLLNFTDGIIIVEPTLLSLLFYCTK